MKKCNRCKEIKSFDSFGKLKSAKDGYRYECKECRKSNEIKYKEQVKEYKKEYHQKNKEILAEKKKIYISKNRQKVTERQRKWVAKNKDRVDETRRKWYNKNKSKKKDYDKALATSLALFDKLHDKIEYAEEVRRDPNNNELLQVKCSYNECEHWFNPNHSQVICRIKALEGRIKGEARFYCSQECKDGCPVYIERKRQH